MSEETPFDKAQKEGLKLKVILVGVGWVFIMVQVYWRTDIKYYYLCDDSGATSSGKTTLAKHLRNILPSSVIVHQDVSL